MNKKIKAMFAIFLFLCGALARAQEAPMIGGGGGITSASTKKPALPGATFAPGARAMTYRVGAVVEDRLGLDYQTVRDAAYGLMMARSRVLAPAFFDIKSMPTFALSRELDLNGRRYPVRLDPRAPFAAVIRVNVTGDASSSGTSGYAPQGEGGYDVARQRVSVSMSMEIFDTRSGEVAQTVGPWRGDSKTVTRESWRIQAKAIRNLFGRIPFRFDAFGVAQEKLAENSVGEQVLLLLDKGAEALSLEVDPGLLTRALGNRRSGLESAGLDSERRIATLVFTGKHAWKAGDQISLLLTDRDGAGGQDPIEEVGAVIGTRGSTVRVKFTRPLPEGFHIELESLPH